MSRDLVKSLSAAAKSLKQVASWPSKLPTSNSSDDYLFEVYVLSCLLCDLRGDGWQTSLLPGHGDNANCLPRKPANKSSGWATFLVTDRSNAQYEICCGTRIHDINEDTRAPDISIQKPVGVAHPTYAHVVVVIDAKYKTKTSTRISSHEFSEFSRWLELLKCKGKSLPLRKSVLDKNSLVTNGCASTEKQAERTRTGVSEVYNFRPNHAPSRLP